MHVLIPMAGRGQRFASEGFKLPKPLIDVAGKPMIVRVMDNLSLDAQYIFIIRKEHNDLLTPVLLKEKPDAKIICIDEVTEGAACTCLLAKEIINNNDHLLIANCDQIMDWNKNDFLTALKEDVDGYIFTFTSDAKNNSYLKLNHFGMVTLAVEKQVISDIATTGVYHWTKGKYMVESCEKMISKNLRCNNEFYLCPSYNEMISDGKLIRTIHVNAHYPIGVPEDLERYLKCKLTELKK